MLKLNEFMDWYDDYRGRWPSVSDYAARQTNPTALVDTWHQSLAAFDSATLDRLTVAIIQGREEPVENVKLGVFANEIRMKLRRMLDRDRHERHVKETAELGRRQRRSFSPLKEGESMVHQVLCAVACNQLVSEKTGEPIDASIQRFTQRGGISPREPYDAAIILSGDHTEEEEHACLATLDSVGVTWEEIESRVKTLRDGGFSLLKGV